MLIGVTGGKGSGKDTIAEAFNYQNLKFAGPLKDMLRILYDSAGVDPDTIERKIEGDLKEEPCVVLGGKTPRFAMQTLGTEWRNMIDQKLWSNIFFGKAQRLLEEGTPVICTDVRFEHEAEIIRTLGGRLVRVYRPGQEQSDSHSSEVEMEALEVDETIYNTGSIQDLQAKAARYIQEQMS